MLDRLEQQPPDALLALIKLHDADPRVDKIDLGVGVYRTAPQEIAQQVAYWFGEGREEMERMAANARRLGNPQSTHQIVADLAELIELTPTDQPSGSPS